ncbi:hypothetical protein [Pseudomonas putida]
MLLKGCVEKIVSKHARPTPGQQVKGLIDQKMIEARKPLPQLARVDFYARYPQGLAQYPWATVLWTKPCNTRPVALCNGFLP